MWRGSATTRLGESTDILNFRSLRIDTALPLRAPGYDPSHFVNLLRGDRRAYFTSGSLKLVPYSENRVNAVTDIQILLSSGDPGRSG
jgi:hypothetical protein